MLWTSMNPMAIMMVVPQLKQAYSFFVLPGRATESPPSSGDSLALSGSTKSHRRTLKVEIHNFRSAKIVYLNFQCSAMTLGGMAKAWQS
eukprot:gene25893-biopygen11394